MNRKRAVYLAVGAVSAIILVVLGALYLDRAERGKEVTFSVADQWLLPGVFSMQMEKDANGKMIVFLGPRFNAPVGLPPGTALEYFVMRGMVLAKSHEALLKEDRTYAKRFSEFSSDIVSQLGMRATLKQGRQLVYAEGTKRGIYQALVKRAGPGPVEITVIPKPFFSRSPFGGDQPFTSGYDGSTQSFPNSVMPFHYCSGMAKSDSNGITVSGGDTNPFVKAYHELIVNDPDFRDIFNKVNADFIQRAAAVDPFDVEATSKLTEDFRSALLDAGIAERIEKQAGGNLLARH